MTSALRQLPDPAPPAPAPARDARPAPGRWQIPPITDPRWPFAGLLALYCIVGTVFLRFNRTPVQMLLTVAGTCALDMALHRVVKGRYLFPLSACISGLSLALLLNYSHDSPLIILPVLLTVGSKYVLTYEGRHVFNPSMFGVAASLILGGDLISAAPAYQWGGTWAMSAFVVMAAVALFLVKIGRNALILSFLGFYFVQILLRAWYLRYYLPWETLVLGTLSSAPFLLFVFYMISDPMTSPKGRRAQVLMGLALVVVDLFYHTIQSLYTFFFAAFTVASARFLWLHGTRLLREGPAGLARAWSPAYRRALLAVAVVAALAFTSYRMVIHPSLPPIPLAFRLEPVPAPESVVVTELSDRLDPRVRHLAKWLGSVGDAASVADFDGDGKLDLFLTNPWKRPQDRAALYRGLGNLQFERFEVPALRALAENMSDRGFAAMGVFADYDNDGDQDLLVSVGYGKTVLLKNLLRETGRPGFEDVSESAGIASHSVSSAATFLDYDKDGLLDIFVANAYMTHLRDYDPPRPFNPFRLPPAEYPGDRRMLHFIHNSWDNADNGGLNALYRNLGDGRFQKMDVAALGMPETHVSFAVAAGDLDQDGWDDLYVANDFGPDDLYLNDHGRGFRRVAGRVTGEIGRDSYKGMNVAMGDVDNNGWLDIYVSNVHAKLAAEGSLLWMFYPPRDGGLPRIEDEATRRGALNEHRWGWGAALGDLDNDGWLDLVQANGMFDDAVDRRYDGCPDYWYVNEKVVRSGPQIISYADMWADLRGRCLNPRDPNRVYLSRGDRDVLQFEDVGPRLGWGPEPPSRGALLADFDNDGDLDVLITHQFAPSVLFRNTLGEGGGPRPHWIGLALEGDGVSCNRDAVGTKVVVTWPEGGREVRRFAEVQSVNSFAAQGDRRLHFGLASYAGPVRAAVQWCGAGAPVTYSLPPDRYHSLGQAAAR